VTKEGNQVPQGDGLFDLSGRVALVTGGSSGLGETVARALAGAGAKVGVVGRRRDRLARLAKDIGCFALECDLLDAEALDTVVPRIADRWRGPDILVNAAGAFAGPTPAEAETPDQVRSTLELNLVAPMRLCQAVFPHMMAAGGGAIVNVSSISGRVGVPGIPQASYAASKAGLSGLSVELAVQWAPHAVRVNSLVAGFFKSEMTQIMYEDEGMRGWLRRNTPLPFEGRTEDLAATVLWLVSDAGRYVTGQAIVVDGGWTAK
jgi:NAD(P)-dependent dehydrogenase (short-subunit alcohol dehydrogenase family)